MNQLYPIELSNALPSDLAGPADRVAAQLSGQVVAPKRLGVAYSGGVDSTVLAALAARALGRGRVVLLLGVSDSLAKREHRHARRQAAQLGLDLVEVPTSELSDPDYAANPVNRCFYCKNTLFTTLNLEHTAGLDLGAIAYGENADDAQRPDRPGAQAASKHRVLRPLAEAQITKDQVRALARHWQLITAEKPAAPCLASRIPHGEEVSSEKLAAIDAAEDAVLAVGFSDCRVRHHGTIARIEVPASEIALLGEAGLREELVHQVKAAGFSYVTLDLAGLQSGAFTTTLLGLPS